MKGLLQVYTGEGKGKTTAAAGLALRGLGAGRAVIFAQFFKSKPSSEIIALKRFAPLFRHFRFCGDLPLAGGLDPVRKQRLAGEIEAALGQLAALSGTGGFAIAVLDEILVGLKLGLLSEKSLLDFCRARPAGAELVLTGRGATPGIIAAADLVTRMEAVKHPFERGVRARPGIEY